MSGRFLAAAALASVWLAAGPAAPAAAQAPARSDTSVCQNDEAAPADRIAACTRVIGDASSAAGARADAYLARGALHEAANDYAKAIADLTIAIEMAPSAAAYLHRGNAHDGKREFAKAIADYTEAIRLDPEDAAGYYNRATVFQDRGEKDKAAADYRKALSIDPKYEAARQGLKEVEGK